jgi:5'-methylthioadenosine phosphorylase
VLRLKLGFIGGSGLFDSRIIKGTRKKKVKTPYGMVVAQVKDDICFIQRHGDKKNTPPHKINHRANILAMMKLGVENIIGICSVASLKKKIPPGTIILPDDYMELFNTLTYYDDSIVHTIPGFSEEIRQKISEAAKKAKVKTINKGIYAQIRGPRFETKAEMNLLKDYADMTGMTLASEATLAKELEMEYAALCSVDNLANGLSGLPIEQDEIKEMQKKNVKKIKKIISELS